MNRRGFLSGLMGTPAVALALIPAEAPRAIVPPKPRLDISTRQIVRDAFMFAGIIRPGMAISQSDYEVGLNLLVAAGRQECVYETLWLAAQLGPIYKRPLETLAPAVQKAGWS